LNLRRWIIRVGFAILLITMQYGQEIAQQSHVDKVFNG
jgi:hypothetical protein